MFSVIFPGQGSQFQGMIKDIYDNHKFVRELFETADDIMNKSLSKIIFEGSKAELDLTENTQPAIFLTSYSIYQTILRESNFNIKNAEFFAGHSLGEYSALCCSDAITFERTVNLLKIRGKAMQDAVPKGTGGMIAILGVEIAKVQEILDENKNNFECFIANDNCNGQIVVSGNLKSIDSMSLELKKKNIKNIKLSVSAPFHCPLMSKATEEMKTQILGTHFKHPNNKIISNVTAKPVNDTNDIKKLLIEQIEHPVRWRESIENMINFGVKEFIEIGPGKVLSGLVKRIDRNIKLNQVNNLIDIKNL